MTTRVKAIFFDNDGVLAHTEQHWLDANLQVMGEMAIPYSREDFIKHTFVEGWGTAGWLERQGISQETIREFNDRRNPIWRTNISAVDVTDPTAVDVLRRLGQARKLGVVTNTASKDFKTLHWNAKELLSLFDVMILREHYKNPKPAPDAYLVAIAALGVSASEVVVIEDSPRGIASARTAGASVIAIRNPDFPELDLSNADNTISRLEEISGLLES